MEKLTIIKIIKSLDLEMNKEFILSNDYNTVYKFTENGLLSAPNIKDRDKGYFCRSGISFNVFINSEVVIFK